MEFIKLGRALLIILSLVPELMLNFLFELLELQFDRLLGRRHLILNGGVHVRLKFSAQRRQLLMNVNNTVTKMLEFTRFSVRPDQVRRI